MRKRSYLLCILGIGLLLVSCSGGDTPAGDGSAGTAGNSNASLNKEDYPVFPDADAGADPSVPADQGGKGFTGEGWDTNKDFDLIGDPRAVKGGLVRDYMMSFPGTFRMAGPEWNTSTNYMIAQLVYESLMTYHPTTLAYMPILATHWQILPDKLTFRFRIDPNAKFSDGTPVTSEDVVATWKFYTDKGIQDAFYNAQFAKLEQPVAESKYIVRMKAKELGWMNFDIAATMRIFPAHVLKTFDGAAYLKDYNFKLMPGSGPYVLNEADIQKGQSVTLRRRKDYWAEKYRANIGQYNFDEMRSIVVRDQNLAFEMFKKGELDYFIVNRSKTWVEELDFDKFKQGVLVKRKVFNNYPAPVQYMAFNTRRQPWDDVRVRQAFALLFNREQLIEKLFYKEYLPTNSFFPGTADENPDNPKNLYNPEEALRLLAEAGWNSRDSQGRLTKNGKPLQVDLVYVDKSQETYLTVYQDDLRKVGIGLNLRLVSPEASWKMKMQRQFDFSVGAWGVGNVFPIPKPEYHSSMADIQNTNNISGFKDKRIDQLTEEYEVTFDVPKRTAMLRELDGILTKQQHYVMQWYAPATRIAYWNKFSYPAGSFSRIGDYEGSLAPGLPQLWWIDPVKQQKLEQAMRDPAMKLEIPPVEDRYWQEYGKKETK
jgi:microcin C transport system substrate-binding protein